MTPDVEPGYLKGLLPGEAPTKGEKWDDIFNDFETKIIPGVSLFIKKQTNREVLIIFKYILKDHPLAASEVSCIFSLRQLLPVHYWRNAVCRSGNH